MRTQAKSSPLPKALAQRAEAKSRASARVAREEAEELLAVVVSRRRAIAEAFYDVGQALTKLREPRLYHALGCKTFGELITTRLGLSLSRAGRLIAIAEQLTRARAIDLGQERSAALVQLARATSDEDSAETLARDGVILPGRTGRVSPSTLSVRDILGAAHHRNQLRAARKEPGWASGRRAVDRAVDAFREGLLRAGVSAASTRVALHSRKKVVTVHIVFPVADLTAAASAFKRNAT